MGCGQLQVQNFIMMFPLNEKTRDVNFKRKFKLKNIGTQALDTPDYLG